MYINKKVLVRRVGVWTVTIAALNGLGMVSSSFAVGISAGIAAILLTEKITPGSVFEKTPTVWICPKCLPNKWRVSSPDPGVVARFRNQHAQLHLIGERYGSSDQGLE